MTKAWLGTVQKYNWRRVKDKTADASAQGSGEFGSVGGDVEIDRSERTELEAPGIELEETRSETSSLEEIE